MPESGYFSGMKWLLILLLPTALLAQEKTDVLFNRYYAQSIEKLREIYTVRNAAFICQPGNAGTNYQQEVKEYIRAFKAKAPEVGVLFYSVSPDTMRIWLGTLQQWRYAETKIKASKLADIEYQLRTALGVESLAATRAPLAKTGDEATLRSSIKKSAIAKPASLQKAIQDATALLLPASIADGLKGLSHLFIIPEYNIGQFPFHVLQPYGNNSYLVDSLSWSFVPHLCNFEAFAMENAMKMGKPNQLKANNPLVVGNPAYSQEAPFYLPDLPGAAAEASLVGNALETTSLLQASANISRVKQLAPKADLLYFATHGHFDNSKMLDGSFLAFAPDSSSATGLLSARDIQQMKLKAELAILSACQTGFGKVFAGGFHGIGRAFYKAGVNFSVISLWSVNDAATKELMIRYLVKLMNPDYFYPARQLQEAIQAVKKKYPEPANWAAFSVFGFTY